jgi:hypothetical protein
MNGRPAYSAIAGRTLLRVVAALLCLCLLLGVVLLGASEAGAEGTLPDGLSSQQLGTPGGTGVVATLEECLTTGSQEERAATFSGEMTALPGTARMAMRIELQERVPGELEYRTVTAAGLGVWRPSDPKVKVYKYVKQVSNLSAPASYRALVRFHWLNSKGHVVKRAERITTRCTQPAPATEPTESTTPSSTSTGSSGTSATPNA